MVAVEEGDLRLKMLYSVLGRSNTGESLIELTGPLRPIGGGGARASRGLGGIGGGGKKSRPLREGPKSRGGRGGNLRSNMSRGPSSNLFLS